MERGTKVIVRTIVIALILLSSALVVFGMNTVTAAPKSIVPDAPTGLVAVPGNGQVSLSWNAPTFDGGSAIDYYIVFQDGVDVAHPALNSITIMGLNNGLSYSFAVGARNSEGTGPLSDPVPVIPLTIPGTPVGLSAFSGNGQVSLSWSAPTSDGGAAIDYYIIFQEGTDVAHPTSTSTIVTELPNGMSYSFNVAAHNAVGIGSQSSSVSATPNQVQSVPGAPTGPIATSNDSQVTLSWSAPASDGGATIDYYLVYVNGVARPEQYSMVSMTINGLTNGQQYNFTVAAHNIVGIGLNSTMIQATPYTVPDAPTGYIATPGNGQVTLNWTAPTFDGGRPIDYYIVYQDGAALPYHLSGPSTVISGLINGQTYSFTVSAHNLAGNGTQSSVVLLTPFTAPGAPTALTAVFGNAQVNLSWSAPASNGGAAIDFYVVYQDGIALPDNPPGLMTVITGLTNGQAYSFNVAAHNLAGMSPMSGPASSKPYTTPGAPTGFSAVASNAQVTLSWSVPAYDGGSPIDYYVVYRDGVALPEHLTGLTEVKTGLVNGHNYSFKVSAHNAAGIGAQTSAAYATPFTVPTAPADLMTFAGNENVTLSWSPPSDLHGSPLIGYSVYRGLSANSTVKIVDNLNSLGLTDRNLTNGLTYFYRVIATNAAGSGPAAKGSVEPMGIAPSPKNVKGASGDTSVILNWQAPATNGGYPLTSYKIFRSEPGNSSVLVGSVGPNVLNYVDATTVRGKIYSYSVQAGNQYGDSRPSATTSPIHVYSLAKIETVGDTNATTSGYTIKLTAHVSQVKDDQSLPGLSVVFQYSGTAGKTWNEISSGVSDINGNCTIDWIPSATGNFNIKASWVGNDDYFPVVSTVNLALTSADKHYFTVQSNSTIASLGFDSFSKKLSFTVSGTTGTSGYIRIVIGKDLVANGSEIKISLDGVNTGYALISTDSYWIISFDYHHSSHQIVADLDTANSVVPREGGPISDSTEMILLAVLVSAGVLVALLLAYYRRNDGQKGDD